MWTLIYHSAKFALDLNAGGENLSEVNGIIAVIGHCTRAT